MSYEKRTGGPRHYRHDPASHGIFIHGGTCVMHGPHDPFKHYANPNNFSITWPTLNGEHAFQHPIPYGSLKTFKQALDLAKEVRAVHPEIHHCPIYACTDMLQEKPWMGKCEVQLVSHRLARRKADHDILMVYDNGGATCDRYTIYLTDLYNPTDKRLHVCLGLSENPGHPQGFSQFSCGHLGPHNGKAIPFSALPENVRRHAISRLSTPESAAA